MWKRCAAAAGLLVLGLVTPSIGAPLPGSPLEGIACSSCHLAGNQKGVPPGRAYLLLEAQELLCAECHQAAVERGHPSGFVPSRTLPVEYPLDFTGSLTCSSCHWVHQPEHGAMRGFRELSQYCTDCHAY